MRQPRGFDGQENFFEKNRKKVLTFVCGRDNIILASVKRTQISTERYRSGHNGAVLKTVCLHGHMGSNPILSALEPLNKWFYVP